MWNWLTPLQGTSAWRAKSAWRAAPLPQPQPKPRSCSRSPRAAAAADAWDIAARHGRNRWDGACLFWRDVIHNQTMRRYTLQLTWVFCDRAYVSKDCGMPSRTSAVSRDAQGMHSYTETHKWVVPHVSMHAQVWATSIGVTWKTTHNAIRFLKTLWIVAYIEWRPWGCM